MIKDVLQSIIYNILDIWELSRCTTIGEEINEFGKIPPGNAMWLLKAMFLKTVDFTWKLFKMFGEVHWMQNSKHSTIPILQKYAYKKDWEETQQNINSNYHLFMVVHVILIFSLYTILFSKDFIESTCIQEKEAIQNIKIEAP